MQTNTIIEDIVRRELKSCCGTCVHKGECNYYKASTKTIIQCQLFEVDQKQPIDLNPRVGLCVTCDKAHHCTLPGRRYGVWHCNEFS